jgi:hypothetical protein
MGCFEQYPASTSLPVAFQLLQKCNDGSVQVLTSLGTASDATTRLRPPCLAR